MDNEKKFGQEKGDYHQYNFGDIFILRDYPCLSVFNKLLFFQFLFVSLHSTYISKSVFVTSYLTRIFEFLFIYLPLDRILWLKSAMSRFWSKTFFNHFPHCFQCAPWLKLLMIPITIWVCNQYDFPKFFERLSLEWFCKIIFQKQLCSTILDIHFTFLYSVLYNNKIYIFICLNFPVQSFLLFLCILIELWLSWYTILFVIMYLLPCQKYISHKFKGVICSHQLAPPPWSFFI